MERGIFHYIIKNTLPQQFVIFALILGTLPIYYVTLDLPKQIINKVISAAPEVFPAPLSFLGISYGMFSQMQLLIVLCGLFLGFVSINGVLKYVLNVYKGLLGEKTLHRLRGELFSKILRFPRAHFKSLSHSELVSIISAEVEPLGGFIGDALSQPLYQGGLLATAISFIFIQDPMMGFAVIALYPIQIAIVPRLQKKVNELGRQRIHEVRNLSEGVTEAVNMVQEIQLSDAFDIECNRFGKKLDRILNIRREIYLKKFFIKFLNNFIAQLTPLFLFAIGGTLVLRGEFSLGGLVSILAAYKDMSPPWRELIDFYQLQQDARIKYEQIVVRFTSSKPAPSNHRTNALTPWSAADPFVVAENLSVGEDGRQLLKNLSLQMNQGDHIAVIGPNGSGKGLLSQVVAGLVEPDEGVVLLKGVALSKMGSSEKAALISYVGNEPAFINGSVLENLTFGMNEERSATVQGAVFGSVRAVCLDGDLGELGLRMVVPPGYDPGIEKRILKARFKAWERYAEFSGNPLVEPLHLKSYNTHATIGENIAFGRIQGAVFDDRKLLENRQFRRAIERTGLEQPLTDIGYDAALIAVQLDDQVDRKNDLIANLNVALDDLPRSRSIVASCPRENIKSLARRHRKFLLALSLNIISGQQEGVTISASVKQRILAARDIFVSELSRSTKAGFTLYDWEKYHPSLSIRENILFGKIIQKNVQAERALDGLLKKVVVKCGLTEDLKSVGLKFRIGNNGALLSHGQKQKLALARGLLAEKEILLINDAISDFGKSVRSNLIRNVIDYRKNKSLFWVLRYPGDSALFPKVITVRTP